LLDVVERRDEQLVVQLGELQGLRQSRERRERRRAVLLDLTAEVVE
jgi:hypothetical protein